MPSRLEKLIHYIIWAVPPEQLGATKLAKILWFADVEHYRSTGKLLSHTDNYRKLDQGPLHVEFYSALDHLKQTGFVAERPCETPVGVRREFLWLKRPDMGEFTGDEITTLHSVIEQIRPLSAKQVSDLSHVEPWDSAIHNERLPVHAAAVQFGTVEDDDMAWAESEYHAVRETA